MFDRESEEQWFKAFEDNPEAIEAYYILKYTDTPVFLTGKAGAGKSTFINLAKTLYKTMVEVVAPTGIAARNIDGSTINSLFRLPPRLCVPTPENIAQHSFSKEAQMFLHFTDVLIIDEISMVNSATLDFMDKFLKKISNSNEPFGGKKILMVGDPFQLPPIVSDEDKKEIRKYYRSEHFFDSNIFKEMKPVKIELKKNYRQKDEQFMNILNGLRNYSKVSESINLLNRLCYDKLDGELAGNKIKVTFNNREADRINDEELDTIDEPEKVFEAEITGAFDWRSILIEKVLKLKVGARVMLLHNDFGRLFVNGTLGFVTGFDADKVLVVTDEGATIPVPKLTWSTEEAKSVKRKKKWIKEYNIIGTMTQYPMKLAWAITVHKSQGLTFDNVHLVNNTRAFAPGQLYVALSRCRSLEGLKIEKRLMVNDVKMDSRIVSFYKTINDEERVESILNDIADRLEQAEDVEDGISGGECLSTSD
jgi:ATP-dependent exoDNAse (exonuclease V) alpha subunit